MQEDSDLVHPYRDRIYLPSKSSGVDAKEYLLRYVEKEFPEPDGDGNVIYSVPRRFQNSGGEKQAGLAEEIVFNRLHGLAGEVHLRGLWLTFFHSASYAGQSYRNHRDGKLIIREHDFVIFIKCYGKYYVLLVEVKSSHDAKTTIENIDVTSDAKVIKNNKRSAQHQLRDHLEVLQSLLQCTSINNVIQSYIMWPFLSALTKDPKHAVIRRWKEESHLHLFEDILSDQECFNRWFTDVVLTSSVIQEEHFITLLNRYTILSCGVFVDEINNGMLALLNQEQRELLNDDYVKGPENFLVVHGAAGTGKTLLVLKKLEQLYWSGRLNENDRALYICYWPGIRCEIQQKLKSLGIDKYVDTTRFYISQTGFLLLNNSNYKHIFMDESEAVCLSFDNLIMKKIISTIFQRYHNGNCTFRGCVDHNISPRSSKCCCDNWGELWFLVDINQASLFLPKHSPQILKTPNAVLSKVMRSTGYIFDIFRQFYTNPMPMLPQQMLANVNIPIITLGHHIRGPPIYWADTETELATNNNESLHVLVKVIIDLCATKGFKPNDLCVIPILVSQRFLPESINREIDRYFVDKGYRPRGVGEIETFLTHKEVNDFLVSWVLKIKGLEFKVVLMVIDEDDYDVKDSEDRKKTYIMASRCTCLLILISPKCIKDEIDLYNVTEQYPFNLPF